MYNDNEKEGYTLHLLVSWTSRIALYQALSRGGKRKWAWVRGYKQDCSCYLNYRQVAKLICIIILEVYNQPCYIHWKYSTNSVAQNLLTLCQYSVIQIHWRQGVLVPEINVHVYVQWWFISPLHPLGLPPEHLQYKGHTIAVPAWKPQKFLSQKTVFRQLLIYWLIYHQVSWAWEVFSVLGPANRHQHCVSLPGDCLHTWEGTSEDVNVILTFLAGS